MRHGDDKARDMARSILPSRWRGAPAERARLQREARRQVHGALRWLLRDPETWEDGIDLDEGLAGRLSSFVWQRRAADKLNPFMRWATEHTRALPLESRLGAMRAVLPRGLIGAHAVQHLERRPEFDTRLRTPFSLRRRTLLERGEVAELLRRVVDTPGGLRALNEALRRAVRVNSWLHDERPGPRRLLGRHDVLPFLDAIGEPRQRVARYVVDDFCFGFKVLGAPAQALESALPRQQLPWGDTEFVRPGSAGRCSPEVRFALRLEALRGRTTR
jgi:hypothetical protein